MVFSVSVAIPRVCDRWPPGAATPPIRTEQEKHLSEQASACGTISKEIDSLVFAEPRRNGNKDRKQDGGFPSSIAALEKSGALFLGGVKLKRILMP